MRPDDVTVELRPRSPWEAAELGTALVRTHAGAIWKPWLACTLPVFAIACAIGWMFDALPWTLLFLWWVKPVFDRIPLFVLSRAVFGDVPTPRATLTAQRAWGWKSMLHQLTWRRLSPYRALHLPVDLLEGGSGRARRRVIAGAGSGVAGMLTLVFANFEIALLAGLYFLLPLFMPSEMLQRTLDALWANLATDRPQWAELLILGAWFGAVTLLEPFYVGAGFGLYLNRRTQLEAWDVEIVFRRLRARLGGGALAMLLAIGLCAGHAPPAMAQGRATVHQHPADAAAKRPPVKPQPPTLPRVFGDAYVPTDRIERDAKALEHDPDLHPTESITRWVARQKPEREKEKEPGFLPILFGVLFESGLWIALGILVLMLVLTWRNWWPWLRSATTFARMPESPVQVAPVQSHEAIPADIAATARTLWRDGQRRRALALLYRGSVEWMVVRTGAFLAPGATEAECLRAARQLGAAEDRDAFNSVVRTWQYAAYADRLPDAETFDALVDRVSQRFGWAA